MKQKEIVGVLLLVSTSYLFTSFRHSFVSKVNFVIVAKAIE